MSLIEAMQKRRSIRKYTDEKIDDAVIENILRAGMLAESGKAIRPWEFIVVRDRGMLDKMAKCRVGAAKMLEGADCAILVIADPAATDVWIEDCSVVMTDKPCSEVEDTVRDMLDTAHNMGVSRDIDPFITLSFMALTVIPELRLTERGLFDVNEMSYLNA